MMPRGYFVPGHRSSRSSICPWKTTLLCVAGFAPGVIAQDVLAPPPASPPSLPASVEEYQTNQPVQMQVFSPLAPGRCPGRAAISVGLDHRSAGHFLPVYLWKWDPIITRTTAKHHLSTAFPGGSPRRGFTLDLELYAHIQLLLQQCVSGYNKSIRSAPVGNNLARLVNDCVSGLFFHR